MLVPHPMPGLHRAVPAGQHMPPDAQQHTPLTHARRLPTHCTPHCPQFISSVLRSTHRWLDAHQLYGDAQLLQRPSTQRAPAGQAFAHPPQFAASLIERSQPLVFCPSQSAKPGRHSTSEHTPASEHVVRALENAQVAHGSTRMSSATNPSSIAGTSAAVRSSVSASITPASTGTHRPLSQTVPAPHAPPQGTSGGVATSTPVSGFEGGGMGSWEPQAVRTSAMAKRVKRITGEATPARSRRVRLTERSGRHGQNPPSPVFTSQPLAATPSQSAQAESHSRRHWPCTQAGAARCGVAAPTHCAPASQGAKVGVSASPPASGDGAETGSEAQAARATVIDRRSVRMTGLYASGGKGYK